MTFTFTDFDKAKTKSKKNCVKGMPCGFGCISKAKKCKKRIFGGGGGYADHITDPDNLEKGAESSGATAVTGENAGFTIDKNLEPVGNTPEDSEFVKDYKAWKSESDYEDRTVGDYAKALNENAPPPTEDQAIAIRAYTGSSFKNMNSYLRDGGKRLDEYSKEDARDKSMKATEGLRGTPSYEGDVYRGTALRNEIVEKMEVGGTYSDKGFLSTSTDRDTAENFKDVNQKPAETHTPTILYIDSNRGKNVKPVSLHKREDEILFEPSTKFKIDDMVKEDGLLKVWLKDI